MTTLPVATKPLTRVTALALTEQIRKAVNRTWELLLAAYEGQAHIALGYPTWQSYITAEFNMSRQQSYKLLDVGTVTLALEEATGVSHASDNGSPPIQVSVREAQAVKGRIEEVKAEVAQAVAEGAEPAVAVREAVSKRVPPSKPKAKPEPPRDEADTEAAAIEAEEVERKARIIPVDAVPVLVREDVVYFIKGMDEMPPREVARLITEREVMAHNRWWGSVIAARQEMQPLAEAARQRQAAERQKTNA